MAKIKVEDTEISVVSYKEQDYISLTDMATAKESESRAADIIKTWLRNRYTIEFLGTWEMIHNPYFKVVEFDHFRMQAGLPNFVLSVSEWIEKTGAIGIWISTGGSLQPSPMEPHVWQSPPSVGCHFRVSRNTVQEKP